MRGGLGKGNRPRGREEVTGQSLFRKQTRRSVLWHLGQSDSKTLKSFSKKTSSLGSVVEETVNKGDSWPEMCEKIFIGPKVILSKTDAKITRDCAVSPFYESALFSWLAKDSLIHSL